MRGAIVQRIYVWQLPVRIFHWINALCVAVLIVTGFLIGRPIAVQGGGEASFSYWFGTVRFIHFVAAFVFFFNFVFRTYWGFVGNRYANWQNFIPLRKRQFKELVDVLKVDVFQTRGEPLESVGHNSLAGLTYFLTFLVFVFQCATGFGMYSAMSDAWLPSLFTWVVPLMGGDFAVRQWHHVMLWFFIVFTMVHVYLVFYHDFLEGRGVLSSMAGGWKFIEKKRGQPQPAEKGPAAPGSESAAPDEAGATEAESTEAESTEPAVTGQTEQAVTGPAVTGQTEQASTEPPVTEPGATGPGSAGSGSAGADATEAGPRS